MREPLLKVKRDPKKLLLHAGRRFSDIIFQTWQRPVRMSTCTPVQYQTPSPHRVCMFTYCMRVHYKHKP